VKVAIIGAGAQGRQHATAFRAAGAEVGGIVAGSRASAAAAASEVGARTYASVDAAIADHGLDAVVVATPTATHAAIALSALQGGKHVFCEVPVARDAAEARAMETAAARAGRIVQAGFLQRFEAVWTTFVDIVLSQAFGRPIHLATERLSAFLANGLERQHHGDAIEELLAFDIHLVLWTLGPPERVAAGATWRDGQATDVTAAFACGAARATCFATKDMPRGYPFTERAVMTLERGRVEALNRFWPDRVETLLLRHALNGVAQEVPLPSTHVFVEQARHFINACHGRADPAYAGLTHARAVLDVVQAVRDVSQRGKP